jgi:hypothetical protein
MLYDALREAERNNTMLGLPAYHVQSADSAAQAREDAVAEAKRLLDNATENLMQACCTDMLLQLSDKLSSIASEKLTNMDPGELQVKWQKQKVEFQAACNKYVSQWGDHLSSSICEALTKKSSTRKPCFVLSRFPFFISAVQTHMNAMVTASKDLLLERIQNLVEVYYSETSPWVSLVAELKPSYARFSLMCQPQNLINRIIMWVHEQTTTVISEKLPSDFALVARNVPDSEWIETCASQRQLLCTRINNLSEAMVQILTILLTRDQPKPARLLSKV